jgi:glycosyltransferase involved in cell wall biosynthesis
VKILRVIASMKPEGGGPAQGIRNSIPELERLGAVNEVLCFDSGNESYCGKDPFVIYYLGLGIGSYKFNKKLKTWLLQNFHRYEVVIIHGLWLFNSYGTFRAWKEFSESNVNYPKLFVMPHGMLDPYFQKAKSRKLKALRNIVFWHLFEKQVVNNSNGILFTCEQEKKLARTTFSGYSPNSELNVSYGIQPPPKIFDLKKSFNSFFPQLINKNYILFLSRVHEKKGVDLLIMAYLELKNSGIKMPDLVIAGPGLETDYGKDLIRLSSEDKQIHFLGMVKGEKKWSLLYRSDVFILPSHQENFGIAIVEALACGKVVLITDKVNIYKEIIDGEAGFADVDTLDGVKRILKSYYTLPKDVKESKSQNALKLYEKLFSIKRAAEIFLNKIKN